MNLLPENPRRVLLVMINHHVGDFVLSLPTMRTLAAWFDAPVDAVVDARFAGLARLLPSLREVIPYQQKNRRRSKARQALDFLTVLRRLAPPRYDLVIDIGGGIQSVTLVTLTLARHRIGLAKSRRSAMYTRRLPHEPFVHQTGRYLPFLHLVGRDAPEPLRLRAAPASRTAMEDTLRALFGREPGGIAVMHPGAGYAFRQWPGERFAAVADALAERRGLDTVFIGAPGEEAFLRGIIAQMRRPDRGRPLLAPLDTLPSLFERAQVLVSNESGPTHLAALTELPIVTIFGPSKEAVWRPVREERVTILRGRVCPPECAWGECKHGMACINDLTVARVLEAVDALLPG